MNGKQAMALLAQLYDVAGGIRGNLIELQREITIAQQHKPKGDK